MRGGYDYSATPWSDRRDLSWIGMHGLARKVARLGEEECWRSDAALTAVGWVDGCMAEGGWRGCY